jgi:hypothetical protein
VLHFSNGFNASVTSTGGKADPLAPLGSHLVSIQLSQKGVNPAFQMEGSTDKQTCYIPPA